MNESRMPWVKIYTDIIDDPKLAKLSDATKWRFVQLIVLAGECDAAGALTKGDQPMTDQDIAWRLRVDMRRLNADLIALKSVGILTCDLQTWRISAFEKRQGRTQSEKRERWRNNQKAHRSAEIDASHSNVIDDSSMTERGVIALEKRREREEGEKSKSADASASAASTAPIPASKPAPKEPAKAERPRDLLFDAIAEVTASEPKLLGSRIAKCAKELHRVEATPEQVRQVAAWYSANDWRGRKGEKLTFATLVEVWQQGIANKPAPNGNGKHSPTGEDAGDIAIRMVLEKHGYGTSN